MDNGFKLLSPLVRRIRIAFNDELYSTLVDGTDQVKVNEPMIPNGDVGYYLWVVN